jgi:arylsulfatase A-like enzyme
MVILDGLRRDFVDADRTPSLVRFALQAERFPHFRSAFPSATRVVSATFATGCHPARHTLQGNAMALMEDGVLTPHDVGRPDFLQHKRAVTGHSLAVPTMAELLAPHGGAIIFNNVSPGAAYAHDPDGFGHVYHRAGSFGPGRAPVADPLKVELDAAGDRQMTERFLAEVLHDRRPALAVLWLGEPDHIQHNVPLGSADHLAVLRQADRNADLVIQAVAAERARGDEILLIVGSDHGHETVKGVIDVESELIGAGLKAGTDSADVVALANGTSTLIYVHPDHADRRDRMGDFLRSCAWAGQVVPAEKLDTIGQADHYGLAFAVSMACDSEPNEYGVPGRAFAAKPRWGKDDRLGCGQHGGLAPYEQSPVLLIDGVGFSAGATSDDPVRIVDLAPTIMRHLQVPGEAKMDGRPLRSSP